jgi:rhodanese-related sulfurtransferase
VAAHIPGAISVPLAELAKRVGTLQKRCDIVAYCPGPYCVMALDAVDLVRRKGFRAHRMEHGVSEWRVQGWRVATGDVRHAGGRP